MSDIELYRHIYDRELNRRTKLDESINVIIGTISLLIGLCSYFFSNEVFYRFIECDIILAILIAMTGICIAISILYLIKSYNNYLRGFNYPNISYLRSIREFQKVIILNYNSKVENSKHINFEDDLIDRLIRITDENTKINDKRAEDLYYAKTFIIITLIIIFIISIILIIKKTQLC